ncbi:MAG TPA: hypothetical protein VEC99_08965 [Clostridia bacterium]|nr:hypothetical protein [Clostridia bacterium]
MKRLPLHSRLLKLCFGLLLLAVLIGSSGQAMAQVTNKAPAARSNAAESRETPKRKPGAGPFHGKLLALDKTAKTITVGKRTFYLTSATKIRKGDSPATLEDGVVGEIVSGYVKPAEDGRLMATTVNLGPKSGAKAPAGRKTTQK